MRILLVEDDGAVAASTRDGLVGLGFALYVAWYWHNFKFLIPIH